MAGANSLFSGDKLLTTPNNDKNEDSVMFNLLGLIPKPPNFNQGKPIAAMNAPLSTEPAVEETSKSQSCGHGCHH